ncbi:DUF4843 domain-containing protein [Chitinophaga sp. Cy-1792]|uniref:DUF4843 domain-containing protein n=1 Tax=Chitinophaga sp. Cy-1792 TaxID=2608339 RepID=UPI0014237DB8|nr:DUF4843 domain-containing protein [Chitinophaga sp. Cy-1792]NIG57581.1 DUF4843 domain-containing protein [Chitinophaga sp. Cy-1792]
MKRIVILTIITTLLYSCKKDDIATYTVSKDNIYLNYNNKDSVIYSFAYHPELARDTIWVPVIVSGKQVNHDRRFAINVIDSTTTAVKDKHYEALKTMYILPANAGKVSIPLILLNTDPDLANKSVSLTIEIAGGDDFASLLPDDIRSRRFVFSNRLEQPAWWPYWGQLGKYSRVKHQLFLISSGTTDLVIPGSYPDAYMEIPRALYYISNASYLLNYPFNWVQENPKSGYTLEKRTDGTGDYDFYNLASPDKKFYLKYFPGANKYVFIDENGNQVLY